MSTYTEPQVLDELLAIFESLSGEWEYSGPVSPSSRLFADMALKSLDFAILATSSVRKFGPIPFDELYLDLGERPAEAREITVEEYAAFISKHLHSGS